MKFSEIKQEYIGKMLLSVIDLNINDEHIKLSLKRITKNEGSYGDLDSAHLLLFEDNKALVFVDFDSNGYRSGDWYLVNLKEILDHGATTGIKAINSIVRNIEYFKDLRPVNSYSDGGAECVLITTDLYIIKMGQDHSDSYYPANFFNVEECKEYALRDGEVVDFSEVSK